MKKAQMANKDVQEVISRAHANGISVAHPMPSRQDIRKTLDFIRSINKPGRMPEEVRKERIRKGLPVPSDETPFEIISPDNEQ